MAKKAVVILPVLLLIVALLPAAVFAQTGTPTTTNEVNVEGLVQSLQNNQLVIGGQAIDVSQAVIESGVQAGRFAEIYVRPSTDGTWVARLVELHHDDDSNKVEIKGTITEVGTNHVVIGGRRFDTSNAVLGANLAAGAFVELDLRLNNAGQWVSVQLRLDDDDDRDDDNDQRGDRNDDLNDDHGGDRNGNDDNSGRDDHRGMGSSGHSDDDDDDHSGSGSRGRGGDDDDHNDDHGGDRGRGGDDD